MPTQSFLTSIKENAWIAAIILFFVAIFRDLLKNAVSKGVTKIGGALYNRLAGNRLLRRRALTKYRAGLMEFTKKIAVPFRPNRPLILSDIYVALKVTTATDGESADVWDVLAKNSRVVVTGPPGAGKSMLLRYLASSGIQRFPGTSVRARLPVLLELHRLVRTPDSGELIEDHLIDAFERFGFPRANKFLSTALEKGWIVLLLDGLDEVPTEERAAIAGRLQDFLSRHRECPAIVTCRTAVYRRELDAITDQTVELEPFGDQQIQTFLNAWKDGMPPGKSPAQLMATLREQPKLLAAARNPLLLTIVAHLYSDNPTYALPASRAEFYSQAAAILLDQWQGHLGHNMFERSEKSTVLSQVALKMQNTQAESDLDRRTIVREDAIEGAIKAMPNLGLSPDQVGPLMREIVERSGLLLSIDGGSRYAFAHLTFQEYFVAEALLNRPDDLVKRFEEDIDGWREVVVLWCGLVADSTTMIKAVQKIDLGVALACVAEARSVDQNLADSILKPIINDVVRGSASDEMRRGLGAVAADIRPRGNSVLEALVAALSKVDNPEARLSVAVSLSVSNRQRAAEALVLALHSDPNLAVPIVRLGDLAVPSLAERAKSDNDPILCHCLAQIATPDAAQALMEIMLRGQRLKTSAAWGFSRVVGSPIVSEALSIPEIPNRVRSEPSLDWIWKPFTSDQQSQLPWVVGRAAALIRSTTDATLAIATPDPRIGAALCAISPNPLDTLVAGSPVSL